jgi:hypothetical protein
MATNSRSGYQENIVMRLTIPASKHAINVQKMKAVTNLLTEEDRIMFTKLSIMVPDQMAPFEKKSKP